MLCDNYAPDFPAPSPLETTFSFFITGSTVEVCVETKTAVLLKLVLRDANNNRDLATSKTYII